MTDQPRRMTGWWRESQDKGGARCQASVPASLDGQERTVCNRLEHEPQHRDDGAAWQHPFQPGEGGA